MRLRGLIYNKKFFVSMIIILFVVLLAFLAIQGYYEMERDIKFNLADTKNMVDQRISSLLYEINIFPQDIGDDLIFLSELSSLNNTLNMEKESESWIKRIDELQNDFLSYMKGSYAYRQLSYLDESGQEIVRINFDGEKYNVVPEEALQNDKNELYFEKAISLEKGDIYVSKVYLNTKKGIIENKGTEDKPIYVPVIKTVTPVFNNKNESKGLVVIILYANYFLDDIRRSQREGEMVVLVNPQGYYLAHPDSRKEFSFMFTGEHFIFKDYPELTKEVIRDFNLRIFETDKHIFSLKRIYPAVGNSVFYNGADLIFDEKTEEEYFWILVTISEKKEMNRLFEEIRTNYIYFILFSSIIILTILVLIFILIFGFSNNFFKRKEKR